MDKKKWIYVDYEKRTFVMNSWKINIIVNDNSMNNMAISRITTQNSSVPMVILKAQATGLSVIWVVYIDIYADIAC